MGRAIGRLGSLDWVACVAEGGERMGRRKRVLEAVCLVAALCLLGCWSWFAGRDAQEGSAAAAGRTVFEETISPNEDYVDSEEDVVYYTVLVTQDDAGVATVSSETNSALGEPVSYEVYEVDCEKGLDKDDVSVRWTTLMGSEEASEHDQIAIAVVSVRTADGGVDERKISFVGVALEMVSEALPAGWVAGGAGYQPSNQYTTISA